ncbi:MAG: hypothetical protein ACFFG0_52020, partial [Candidatus Thorarchaeota archaeon]
DLASKGIHPKEYSSDMHEIYTNWKNLANLNKETVKELANIKQMNSMIKTGYFITNDLQNINILKNRTVKINKKFEF